MRFLPLLMVFTLSVSALAQEDKVAARTLFNEGIKLQNEGKTDKALEKFEGAQRYYRAPTITLHIAQCQASLGKLVEANETYRVLENTPRKDDWSSDFVQAQQQGKAEQTQLEARIPKLTINVEPHPAGTKLQVDNTEWDPVFIGVARPVNPGKHRIVAFAPNFNTAEEAVELREKDQRPVTLKLAAATEPGTATPPVTPGQPPVGPTTTSPPTGSAPPPVATVTPVQVPPKPTEPGSALMIGGSLAGLIAVGNLPNVGYQLSEVTDSGWGFELFGGARFGKFVIEAVFETASISKSDVATSIGNVEISSTASTSFFGGMVGYLSSYEKGGIWLAAGAGSRTLTVFRNTALEKPYSGIEGRFEIGYSARISKGLRVIPKLTTSGGQFEGAGHAIVGLAVGGQFDAAPLGK